MGIKFNSLSLEIALTSKLSRLNLKINIHHPLLLLKTMKKKKMKMMDSLNN